MVWGVGCGEESIWRQATGNGRRAKPARSQNILTLGPVWGMGFGVWGRKYKATGNGRRAKPAKQIHNTFA